MQRLQTSGFWLSRQLTQNIVYFLLTLSLLKFVHNEKQEFLSKKVTKKRNMDKKMKIQTDQEFE